MPLDRYHDKRRFDVTPEPSGDGTGPPVTTDRSFVIQKHAASRLHYDFRLEIGGVLASWAVPKGPSLDTRDRRLAMHVEDHPLEYGSFAGTIPAGQYGAGTVEIWDSGTYEPVGEFDGDYAARKPIKFVLHGRRLSGGFTLVPLKPRGNERGDSWLLIKERDEHTRPREEYDVLAEEPPTASPGLVEGPGDDPIPTDEPFQLATLAEEVPVGEQWLHEVKYDGYRLRLIKDHGRVSVRTRNGLDWTGRFPGVAAAAADLPFSSAVLDGEAVVFSDDGLSDFGALQHALSHSDSAGVRYVAFDLLYLDGHDLRGLPLRQRKELLDGLLGNERGSRAATLMLAEHFDGSGPEFWRQACALSLEGVISKRAERPYIGGRSRDWIKIKCALRQEFVVVGFTQPSGSRAGFGALLLAVAGDDGILRYAGRVGTGFSEAVLRELRAKLDSLVTPQPAIEPPKGVRLADATWVRPELIAEVRFREWTREGVIRQASFAGLREDAAVTGVVQEKPATRITNPDKVLWAPEGDGSAGPGSAPVTKADLVAYYESIAEHILPELAGRPLTLVRCPHGLSSECFYQKHPDPRGFPKSLHTFCITEHGQDRTYVHVESLEGLIDLVQLGTLELHAWNSLADDPERPDRIVFDLDPGPDVSWADVCRAGHDLRAALGALGLSAWPKTTGGRGLHLVVPIVPDRGYDEVRALSRAFVDTLATHEPDRFTARMAKREREGRIFVDYLRNARGATAVVAYSTRARAGIPVAVPVTWEELMPALDPAAFNIRTVPERCNTPGFRPWDGYDAARVELEDALFTALGMPAAGIKPVREP